MKKIFSFDSTFANFMNAFGSILAVGILWLLFSIPIITMGAASCAAYDTMVNVVRRGRGYVFSFFFESFKTNLKVSLLIHTIGILVISLLGFDCIYLYGYGTEFSQTLSYILYAFVAVFLAIYFYVYPLMQRFDETSFEIFKLSFYLTFRYLLTSLGLIAVFTLSLVGIYYMPWSILFIPGIWWFIQSLLIERIIRRFGTYSEEDDEEEDAEDVEDEGDMDEDVNDAREVKSDAREVESDAREVESDAREVESDAREVESDAREDESDAGDESDVGEDRRGGKEGISVKADGGRSRNSKSNSIASNKNGQNTVTIKRRRIKNIFKKKNGESLIAMEKSDAPVDRIIKKD